jgi:RND family efflux transporter MFP subunit
LRRALERRVLGVDALQHRALILLLLAGCSDHASHAASSDGSGSDAIAPKKGWTQLKFEKVQVATPRFTDWIPARVAIDETRASRIGPPLGGRVTDVWVERGQRVKAGDRLFAITSGDLAELYSARAKAEVELATARSTLERTKVLVEAKSLPAKELLVAQQTVAEAELELRTATNKITSLHVASGGATSFTVIAPRAGVVVEKAIAVGQQVSPTDAAAVAIADLGEVWIVGDVLDGELGNLKPGTKAEIRLAEDVPVIPANVDQVGAVVDPDRHTIQVRVRLPNPQGALRPNLHGEMRIFDDDNDLIAPAAAVLTDGGHDYVYVRVGDSITRHEVIAGPPENGVRSIHKGIAAGDELVVRGMALLDNQLGQEVPR